ncbi:MAG: rod shape-determining protein MreD [Bacteroidaceae bacterium]|nr:rod shape-determining protein MreD [Bacteroidaceae bacterium]
MITTFLQRLLWLAILVALQLVVFNHIHLFGYATPLVFVYFVTLFPLGTSHWNILLWAFACGMLADITTLTPGVGAAAMTLTALVQPPLLEAMRPKDAPEDMRATFHTLGFWHYVYYCGLLVTVFTLAYFLLQFFNFFHLEDMAISWASSLMLTWLVCILLEHVRGGKKEE